MPPISCWIAFVCVLNFQYHPFSIVLNNISIIIITVYCFLALLMLCCVYGACTNFIRWITTRSRYYASYIQSQEFAHVSHQRNSTLKLNVNHHALHLIRLSFAVLRLHYSYLFNTQYELVKHHPCLNILLCQRKTIITWCKLACHLSASSLNALLWIRSTCLCYWTSIYVMVCNVFNVQATCLSYVRLHMDVVYGVGST